MKQIVTHFTDNDLYTFTCMYYALMTYPDAEVRYQFFDRNNQKYPKGFDKLLKEQVGGMMDCVITDEEVEFLCRKVYYIPKWFFTTFLRGFRFNPSEVHISQDSNGYLDVFIEGKWISAIVWEMVILSTISEMMHILNGDIDKLDETAEFEKAYNKGVKAIENGIMLSDMGTRRRLSFDHQDNVISALVKADFATKGEGKFVGTSNVYFAMKYNLTPIGTMSHQIVSFEECMSGVHECNYSVMEKWNNVFDSALGTYLHDCFGSNVALSNLSRRMAKAFDGFRIDSGDEIEETKKIIKRYKELGVDARTKTIVFSNALSVDKAIDLHNKVMDVFKAEYGESACPTILVKPDRYGIGTELMCDVTDKETGKRIPHMNIVIKLVGMRYNENRKWLNCVKLSNDKGKTLGYAKKCKALIEELKMYEY